MAAPLPPLSILSCSPLCSVSTSLRRTLFSPVATENFGDVSRQRELNSALSPPARRYRNGGPVRSLALVESARSVRCSALDGSAVLDPLPVNPGPDVGSLKLKLLSAVSGLNRGLVASKEDLRLAESLVKELEAAGGPVDLTKDLDKLQGKWKLIYSSAFSSGSLGGNRPGPSIGRLIPITPGQIFQRIDIVSKDFDNIVELQFGTPWPLPQITATATLAHKFELIGTANIKITFQKTTVKATGNLSQFPPLEVPRFPDALRPPSNTGIGEFDLTYIDSDFRITRGDKGELRLFVSS